ncbi:MAG: hypothetical protein K2Z81_22470, partial [Cyanobacteria bacterium]|nr:hypothetical protein [Cyanobacteriota bacterium]
SPKSLHVPKSVPQELFAYSILWCDRHPEIQDQYTVAPQRRQQGAEPLTDIERISLALAHAGARLDRYSETAQGDGVATVRYVVDGADFSATVRLDDLSIVSSGICLSGRDRDFDLTSLVGVMREFARDGYEREYYEH